MGSLRWQLRVLNGENSDLNIFQAWVVGLYKREDGGSSQYLYMNGIPIDGTCIILKKNSAISVGMRIKFMIVLLISKVS